MTIEDELLDRCPCRGQLIDDGLRNGFEELDGIGRGIIIPPFTFATGSQRFIGREGTGVDLLRPCTGMRTTIGIRILDDALREDIVVVR